MELIVTKTVIGVVIIVGSVLFITLPIWLFRLFQKQEKEREEIRFLVWLFFLALLAIGYVIALLAIGYVIGDYLF